MGQGSTPLHPLRMRVLEVNFLLTLNNVALNNVFSGFSDNKEILLALKADNAMALNICFRVGRPTGHHGNAGGMV